MLFHTNEKKKNEYRKNTRGNERVCQIFFSIFLCKKKLFLLNECVWERLYVRDFWFRLVSDFAIFLFTRLDIENWYLWLFCEL